MRNRAGTIQRSPAGTGEVICRDVTESKKGTDRGSGRELLDDGYYANPKSVRFDIGGTRSWKLRATGTGQQSFPADFYQFSDSDKVQQRYALTLKIGSG